MPWTQTILNLKDALGTSQPVIAYTDGTNFSFAHPLLDNTGAIIAPATSTLQTTANTSLATIATAAGLASTSALQTAANTLLSEIQAELAGTLGVVGTVAITGPLSLPTGASTSANQATANSSLATIATNTTGGATAANQATANTSLASITTALTAGVPTGANTSGGTSVYAAWGAPTNAVLTNTPIAIKASPGNLYGLASISNPNGSDVFMQFFDLAAGSVTLGTTAPKMVLRIPAGSLYDRDFTAEEKISFATAITVAVTTTAIGSTAPATGVSGNIIYK
jgi:hypothetical protein